MLTLIWRTIKDRKISLISYCLAGVLFMLMFVSMYPSIHEQAENFSQLFEAYPEEFTQIFNINEIGFDTIEKFLAIEQYSITWPLMVIFFMVSFAGMALAREVEKGTMEILLARPISRLMLYLSRFLTGIIFLAIFTLISIFCLIPFAEIFGVEYNLRSNALTAVLGFLFGVAVFSIAYMFSAIFSEKSKAYMLTGGILLLMYVLRIVANFKEEFQDVKYLSFFHYFDANVTLLDNELNLTSVLVFLGVAIFCTVIGAIWFQKRDIAV